MAADPKLAGFIKGVLAGSVDIGMSLIPLVGAYKAAKQDPEWREKGIAEWLETDPRAGEMLVRVFTRVQETLPETTRSTLILALGGTP